jgi:hypothetical protein
MTEELRKKLRNAFFKEWKIKCVGIFDDFVHDNIILHQASRSNVVLKKNFFVGCDAVYSDIKLQTFRRKHLPPRSDHFAYGGIVILPESPVHFIPNCVTSHPKNTWSLTFSAVRTSNLSCDSKFELELCNIPTMEYLLLSQLLSTDHIIKQSDQWSSWVSQPLSNWLSNRSGSYASQSSDWLIISHLRSQPTNFITNQFINSRAALSR